jgi:1-acyl-sn-glycerol-3-phosphate acyltransferase
MNAEQSSLPAAIRPSLLSRLVKAVLIALYRWKGWKISCAAPVPPRCIILGAPHTSNWDFVFFLGAVDELGIRPGFMGKHTLFRWPFTRFMRDMGGISVDRSAKDRNYVDQVVDEFARREALALVIAPEGTRGRITGWRSGFYHIAKGAGVPIVPAWVDNATMLGGLGAPIQPSGNYDADLRAIAEFYHSVMPDHPKLAVLYAATGIVGSKSDD